jgi:alpha-tubulin suppressor-like RCC1 family protein
MMPWGTYERTVVSSCHARARVHRENRLGLRGVAVLVPLLLIGATFAGGSGPASAAVAPLGCQSVFFLGAIGSGEWADNNGQESSTFFGKATATTAARVGSVLHDLRNDLPGRGIAASSLLYPAVPAIPGTLTPSAGEIAGATGLGPGTVWAVNDYLKTKLTPFMASIAAGVNGATALLESRAAKCPSERIVLAGYSQGAMVMHEVVNKLYDTGQNAILARIGGVVLLADGDRAPYTMTRLTGTPVAGLAGKGIASWQPGKARDIASSLISARTFSICDKDDLVCDFQVWDLAAFIAAGNIHGGAGYENSVPVQVATSQVANIVRGWAAPTPPAQNATATTGQGFHLQLAADVRATGSVLRWRATSALPAGLSLSPIGLISGTPTTTGTWTVSYQVQARPTGWLSDWIPGTVTIHISTTTGYTAYAWGLNGDGQLGDGTTIDRSTLVKVGTDTDWVAIAAGDAHTVAVKIDGTLWAWGDNRYGQLGDGTTTNRSVPVRVGIDTHWASVTAGYKYTLAVKTDGTLWGWGSNASGQLGDGTTIDRSAPVQVGTDTRWASVSANGDHTAAVKTDGTLWGWGSNWGYGMVGDGTFINRLAPVQLGTDTHWASVSAGGFHTVAMKTDGTLWAWGGNLSGQLGDGTTYGRGTPVRVGTDTKWASVSAGGAHTVAIKTDGTLWAWGDGSLGQLGDGSTSLRSVPVQEGTDSHWAWVAAGNGHTAAVKTDGTLWAWGWNAFGQLGDGTLIDRSMPVQVGGSGTHWSGLYAGGDQTLALRP